MKAVQINQDVLVVSDSQYFQSIIGALFFVISIMVFAIFHPFPIAYTPSFIVPLIILVTGFIMFFSSVSYSTTFNKQTNTIDYNKKSLLIKSNQHYALSEVDNIYISKASSGKLQVVLHLRTGKLLPITTPRGFTFSSDNSTTTIGGWKEDKISKQLSSFLNVPYLGTV